MLRWREASCTYPWKDAQKGTPPFLFGSCFACFGYLRNSLADRRNDGKRKGRRQARKAGRVTALIGNWDKQHSLPPSGTLLRFRLYFLHVQWTEKKGERDVCASSWASHQPQPGTGFTYILLHSWIHSDTSTCFCSTLDILPEGNEPSTEGQRGWQSRRTMLSIRHTGMNSSRTSLFFSLTTRYPLHFLSWCRKK